jgi:hypothetical protein
MIMTARKHMRVTVVTPYAERAGIAAYGRGPLVASQ